MLILNLKKNLLNGCIGCDLNTSYVDIKPISEKLNWFMQGYLNTSYVDIKHTSLDLSAML